MTDNWSQYSTEDIVNFLQNKPCPAIPPTVNKFDLAIYLLGSDRHYIPRKQHFLLEWITNVLIKSSDNYKKLESAKETNTRLDRDLADVVMFLTFHRKDGSNKRRPIFLEHKCWRLLLDLLVSDGLTPGSTIVHTKLLTVISMIFNATFTEILDGTRTESQQELLSTANKVLDLLLTKFESGFKPTFEQFGQFVGDMVKVEGFITATNASDYLGGAIEAYLGVLERSLDEFAHQLVDQPNQKKVFSLLVEKLLEGFLILRFKLHSIREKAITAQIHAVLASLESLMGEYIFHPEHVHEFAMSYTATRAKEEVKSDEPKAKRQKTNAGTYLGSKIFSYPKKVFDVLRDMINNSATTADALHSFEFVYRSFLKTMNDDRAKKITPNLKVKKDALKRKEKAVLIEQYSEFNFMMELHDMLSGFFSYNSPAELVKSLNKNADRAANTALALAAMNTLLDTILQFNVYSIPLDTEERYQYHFFLNLSGSLAQFLIVEKDATAVKAMSVIENAFTGFKYLLQLNHNVVEPKLEAILHAAWCLKEKEFTVPIQAFSITLVNTYSLLRQFDNFLQLLMDSMKKINITSFFPHHTYWKAFNTSVEQLPPLQLVQLWKQVAESLFSDYITPVLMQESSVNYLHAVNLFCEFTEHVKITEANVNQINGLVEDNFSTIVAPLLITIIDSTKSGFKQSDSVVFGTLLVYYSLTRLSTFIKYRFSGSLDQVDKSIALPSFFSSIHEDNVQLSEFVESFMATKSIDLKFILIVLLVERCKQLFRHTHVIRSQHFNRIVGALYGQTSKTVESELDAENQKCQKELTKLFSILTRTVQSEYKVNKNTSEFWDGRIVSINKSNFTAALLTLFCENIHIWTDCASSDELQQFSNMILDAGTLLARSHWQVSDPISVLLSNATFFEIPKVQDALLEGFASRLVTAIRTAPNQEIIQNRPLTTENILIQVDEVVSKACTRFFGAPYQVSTVASNALTPVIHACDLLLALPLAPSSAQLQKIVSLLCALSWYTPHMSAELTVLHKLIAKLVQLDWNCNECLLVNYLLQTQYYHYSDASDLILRVYINNICDTKRDKARTAIMEKRVTQLSKNTTGAGATDAHDKNKEKMAAKMLAFISSFYAEKEAHCKYLKQSKSITKETVDELEVRFFIPKFVTTLVQALQERVKSAVNVQHDNSAARLTQIEVQLSLLNFYRLYSSKFRERDRSEETFDVDFDSYMPYIGHLTQLTINELLKPSVSSSDAMEVDQSDNSLKSRVLASLLTVADCLPILTNLSIKAFGLFASILFQLMIHVHGNQEESKQIERIYIRVIQNATKEQIELILDHLKLETRADNLVSEKNNERLMTSMDCLLLFLTNTPASIRYQIMNKQAQIILSNCLTLVTTVAPPQNATAEHLLIKACEIMNRLVVDSFTKLKSRHLSLMLQLFSPFMLNEASSVNGGTDRFTKEYLISERVFTALYFLLLNTLKSRQYEAYKVIAPLLDGIKYLLRQIVRARPDGSYLTAICIQNFSRLCEELSKNKIVTKKFAEYFLVDFVVLVKLTSLPPKIKQHLMPGVYSIMDTCTEYENQQIFAALDDVSKGIFKGMFNEYNRDHKFSGKV